MAAAVVQPLHLAPTAQTPHGDHQVFTAFLAFQAHMQRSLPQWSAQVQQALRLIALNGIRDPITKAPVPAAALSVSGGNYRESLVHNGCLSRHRAVLLVLQELLDAGLILPAEQLELYCPEAITPFAALLRQLFPHVLGCEYLPDLADPQRRPQRPRHPLDCRPIYGVLGQKLPAVLLLVAQRR